MAEEQQQEGLPRGAGDSAAEQEIRALEQRLEEKKRELAARGAETPPEKEVFREVVREHIQSIAPSGTPPILHAAPAPPPPAGGGGAARDNAVQDLVAQALSGSIAAAVEKAYRESPYLLDALHDRLVDEYYDKLLALRKIGAW